MDTLNVSFTSDNGSIIDNQHPMYPFFIIRSLRDYQCVEIEKINQHLIDLCRVLINNIDLNIDLNSLDADLVETQSVFQPENYDELISSMQRIISNNIEIRRLSNFISITNVLLDSEASSVVKRGYLDMFERYMPSRS